MEWTRSIRDRFLFTFDLSPDGKAFQFQFPRNMIPDLSFFSIWLHLRSSTHRCLFITLSLYNFPFLILSIGNRIQIPRLNRGRNETRCSPEYWPINGQILPLFSGKRNGDIVDGALFTET